MKTLLQIQLIIIAGLLFICQAHALDDADLMIDEPADKTVETGSTNADVAVAVEADEAEEEVLPDEKEGKFTRPSLKDIAIEIKSRQGGLSKDQYLYVLKLLRLNDQNRISDFYDNFRDIDKTISKRGKSSTADRVIKEYKTASYRKKYGKTEKDKGTHFVIYFPEYSGIKGGKSSEKIKTAELAGVNSILSSADSAFEKAAGVVMCDKFINWSGKVAGEIYVITDPDLWALIRAGSVKASPAQIVITEDKNREFFVFVNKNTFDSSDQAVGFAVSELVLKEYSRAVTGKSSSKMPLFFLTGAGVIVSELDSAVMETGPKQMDKWGGQDITVKAIRKLRKDAGEIKQLPLSERDLISFEDLVNASDYPKHSEDVYYFARQSAELLNYFDQNGKLAFLVMARNLAGGEKVKDAIDNGYVKVRDKILGKEMKSGKKKSRTKDKSAKKKSRKELKEEKQEKEDAEDTLSGYKELDNQSEEIIFYPLTKESLVEDKKEQAKEAKSRKRRKRK